ncbi:MAG: NAD(P)H-dependent oxidoreductase [Caulobacterales bacterium]
MTRKVAVLVGSLRKESFNRKIAKAFEKIAGDKLSFDFVEIGDLPFYNEDVEAAGAPAAWARVREQVKGADAVLFVTPEYNRSVPGVLKNAVDVISRPYGKNNFSGKPTAVIASSPGALGGFGANHHLRQSLVFLDTPVLQQPEAYLGGVGNWFDESGALTNDGGKDFLTNFSAAFVAWIDSHSK